MVRFEFSPNGPCNLPEFGSVKDVNDFFSLMEMDALLHVKEGTQYPAMLITTGWNDPRVISWQPAKFASAVQRLTGSNKPVLLKVDYDCGHGGSENRFKVMMHYAQSFAFAIEQCRYSEC